MSYSASKALHSQQRDQLQAGQKALKGKEFELAIATFQAVCNQPEIRPELQTEAQMWLAIAYKQSGQPQQAELIAQAFVQSSDPVNRRWATQFIEQLDLHREEDALATPAGQWDAAQLALKEQRYPDAIEYLERYCQPLSPENGLDSGQAFLNLAKAYKHNRQFPAAIAVCQRLGSNPEPMVQMGAMQIIAAIEALQNLPQQLPQQLPTASPEPGQYSPTLPQRSLEELRIFFRKQLLFALAEFEKRRKVTEITVSSATLVFLVLVVGLGWLAAVSGTEEGLRSLFNPQFLFIFLSVASLVFMLLLWVWMAFITSAMETYVRGFKTKVIERLVTFLDPLGRLQYSAYPNLQATLGHLLNSQLFPMLGEEIFLDQDDAVVGKLGETDIFFSEIAAFQESYHPHSRQVSFDDYIAQRRIRGATSSADEDFLNLMLSRAVWRTLPAIPYVLTRVFKGQRIHYSQFQEEILENKVSRKKVFKGLFFRARFNKWVKGKTIILPDTLLTRTTWLNSHRGESIKLEDPEFEKLYEVYGDDQIASRYALSTSLMAKLVDLRKRTGKHRPVYVSLVEDTIYIAIASEQDLFEPRLYRSILDFNLVRQYYEDLQMMAGIVDELNLNRRIWMTSAERA